MAHRLKSEPKIPAPQGEVVVSEAAGFTCKCATCGAEGKFRAYTISVGGVVIHDGYNLTSYDFRSPIDEASCSAKCFMATNYYKGRMAGKTAREIYQAAHAEAAK